MPKTVHRLELTLSDEQWDALNEQRGHEPRASFIKRTLDDRLGTGGNETASPRAPGHGSPSSSLENFMPTRKR